MKKFMSLLMVLSILLSVGVTSYADNNLDDKELKVQELKVQKKLNKVKMYKDDKEIDVLFEDDKGNYVISASKEIRDKENFDSKMAEGWALTIDKTKSFKKSKTKDVLDSYIKVQFDTTATRKRGNAGDSCVVDTFESYTGWYGFKPFYSDSITLSDKMSFSGTNITSVSAGSTGGGIGWSTTSSSSTVSYEYDNGDRWNLGMSFDGITAYAPGGSIDCYMHDAVASHVLNGVYKGVSASGYVFY